MALGSSADAVTTPLTGDAAGDSSRRLPYSTLAPVLAALSCVLFSCNGELLQYLQVHDNNGGGHASPLLNLILCHLGPLVFAPHFLFWKPAEGFSAGRDINVPLASLLLAFLLMGYNYAWLSSARFVAVGLTNAMFQTSVAFVYLASIVVFRDNFESTQLFGVACALIGSFLASGVLSSTSTAVHSNATLGIFLALTASGLCMVYQVLFKYLFGHLKSDPRFLAHIGAWVSVWHLLVILPLAGLAHVVGFETMQLPHSSLAIIGTLASAVIASTVNAIYICLVMWGSSMLLPCTAALSVPCTVMFDLALHHIVPKRFEVAGDMLIMLSAVLILGLHKSSYMRPKAFSPHRLSMPDAL